MKTWVSDDNDLSVLQSMWQTIFFQRYFDRTLPFLQNIPSITNSKEKTRFRYHNATLLATLLVQHLFQFLVDFTVDLGLYALESIEKQTFSEVGAIDVAQEAECIAEVGLGVVEEVEMITLF